MKYLHLILPAALLLAGSYALAADDTLVVNGCRIEPDSHCPGANLKGANLSNQDMRRMDLSGADLSGAQDDHLHVAPPLRCAA